MRVSDQADGDRGEALRCPRVGRTEDDVEEDRGEQHLGDQHGEQAVAARRVLAVAVGGHVARRLEAGSAVGDGEQGQAREEAAGDLGDDVGRHVLPLEALGDGDADRDGRVEVGTRDVPDRVRHRHDGEAERQGDAEEADAELDGSAGDGRQEGGGVDRCATATEDEPERAEELCAEALRHRGGFHGDHCARVPGSARGTRRAPSKVAAPSAQGQAVDEVLVVGADTAVAVAAAPPRRRPRPADAACARTRSW